MWTARACLLCAWMVMCVWGLGMLLTDRFAWSQFLWWIPTPLAFVACLVFLGVAWVLGRIRRWRGPPSTDADRRRWTLLLRASSVAASGIALCFLVAEVRVYRAILPDHAPAPRALRLLTWNISSSRIEDVPQRVAPLSPDVFLIANRPYFGSFSDLRRTVAEDTSVAAGGRLAVVSKYPVIAYTHLPLNISGAMMRTSRWQGGGMVSIDKGEALLVLLDTATWNGGTTCIWFVDLPSDPPIPRARMMREAREAIMGFTGPIYRPRDAAADEPSPADPSTRAALLAPDILSGDCNTPRHSWSLSQLAPGMTPAPDMAGWGWRQTFPAESPVIAIDNTLLGNGVRCTNYEVHTLSTRTRDHLAQVTVLAPWRSK